MNAHGIIEPAASRWASNVVLVRKKDNSLRFCIDYRQLNGVTVQDSYPIPVLFCSLAILDPRVGHTMDVLSPFIPVLCHSD